MQQKFIPLEKIHILEEAINWLSEYKAPVNMEHKVARNQFEKDIENTNLLKQLGKINVQRTNIINQLYTNSKNKHNEKSNDRASEK